jgi:two-component system, OmpR family, sensor histidine kinase VicK
MPPRVWHTAAEAARPPPEPGRGYFEREMKLRVSMRWWLALAFAAVAALTAVAVAEVFTQRAESSFRSRAEELAAGSAVSAAEVIRPAIGTGTVRITADAQAHLRRISLFVFDSRHKLISAAESRGVQLVKVPSRATALNHALGGSRYVHTFDRGHTIVVGLPLKGGRAGALLAYATRPELAAELGIVRTEIVPSALIAVAVGAAVGILVALLIAKRLRRIAGAARAIAAGEFETELRPGFADELGDLERTVDRMRVRLRESFLALGGERDRLRRLLERLHDGVVAVDAELRVSFANQAAADILGSGGLPEGSTLPDPWPEISLEQVVDGLFLPGAAATEARVSAGEEHVYTVVGIPPPPGLPVAVLVFTDVTERERRERAEREFVANAAHELRTPLTAIAGAIEALEAGAKEEPGARDRFLAIVARQSGRLGRLVRALLVLARAQTQQEALRLEPVELAPMLEEAVQSLESRPEAPIELDCEAGLTVLGHRDLLEQIVSNLVGNAVRHAGTGTIAVGARTRGEGVAEIEVTDAGPGIDPLDQERVFDRFYRRGRDAGESFGLGLSIVREAVRALGGTVELDSEYGAGTTVRVVLPVTEAVRV